MIALRILVVASVLLSVITQREELQAETRSSELKAYSEHIDRQFLNGAKLSEVQVDLPSVRRTWNWMKNELRKKISKCDDFKKLVANEAGRSGQIKRSFFNKRVSDLRMLLRELDRSRSIGFLQFVNAASEFSLLIDDEGWEEFADEKATSNILRAEENRYRKYAIATLRRLIYRNALWPMPSEKLLSPEAFIHSGFNPSLFLGITSIGVLDAGFMRNPALYFSHDLSHGDTFVENFWLRAVGENQNPKSEKSLREFRQEVLQVSAQWQKEWNEMLATRAALPEELRNATTPLLFGFVHVEKPPFTFGMPPRIAKSFQNKGLKDFVREIKNLGFSPAGAMAAEFKSGGEYTGSGWQPASRKNLQRACTWFFSQFRTHMSPANE